MPTPRAARTAQRPVRRVLTTAPSVRPMAVRTCSSRRTGTHSQGNRRRSRALSRPIEDYAVIGDTETAALVARDGSMDWLCLPRFDSAACFASLLGDERHGRWIITPAEEPTRVTRRYRPDTMILETRFETPDGAVELIDAMPPRGAPEIRGHNPDVVRVVRGVSGRVAMRTELVIRFDYGSIVPWVEQRDGRLHAVGGPDALVLTTPVALEGVDTTTQGRFEVAAGDEVPFVLTWHPSEQPPPDPVDAVDALDPTQRWWEQWTADGTTSGPWADDIRASLRILKTLSYAPTGGVVAAPTASLPEHLGGVRNWDYRIVWLRDATFTLYALLRGGYRQEALAWRDWLLRTVAGDPSKLQIMYGLAGQRRLTELELPWLPGYADSRPVRIGNDAHRQRQLDVYGEVLDTMHVARRQGIEPHEAAWNLQRALLEHLESTWDEPDNGLWEVRAEPQHFTHSKVMAWVAFDRGVKAVEAGGLPGAAERWRARRDEIREEVLARGYDAERGAFVQTYGGRELDASLLMIPLVGFLPGDDPRMIATVEAVEKELADGPFVHRYQTDRTRDGLPPGEGTFLLCSFWLVDALALQGRTDDARRNFEALLSIRNDVGLLAEMFDPRRERLLGNFPQAFSHVGLINSARNLADVVGPAEERAERDQA